MVAPSRGVHSCLGLAQQTGIFLADHFRFARSVSGWDQISELELPVPVVLRHRAQCRIKCHAVVFALSSQAPWISRQFALLLVLHNRRIVRTRKKRVVYWTVTGTNGERDRAFLGGLLREIDDEVTSFKNNPSMGQSTIFQLYWARWRVCIYSANDGTVSLWSVCFSVLSS